MWVVSREREKKQQQQHMQQACWFCYGLYRWWWACQGTMEDVLCRRAMECWVMAIMLVLVLVGFQMEVRMEVTPPVSLGVL